MKILIIGGTRFIGLATTRRLHALGHEVVVFNRGKSAEPLPDGVKRITGDVNQLADARAEFAAFAPDVVFHNIVLHEKHVADVQDVFTGIAKRFVMVSSMDVYKAYGLLNGSEQGEPVSLPMDEDAPLREVLYPYRAQATGEDDFRYNYDKIPAEKRTLASSELPGTVLRLPMVFGPNDFQRRLLSFFKPMDDGRKAIVMDERYAQWRSTYGYVENVAAAIALACTDDRANGRIYNVGDITPSMLEMAEKIKSLTGWQGEIITMPSEKLPETLRAEAGFQHSLVCSCERIKHKLGYAPVTPLDEAFRTTLEWERANLPEANFAEMFNYAEQDAVLAARA